jgi:hypothetical protein
MPWLVHLFIFFFSIYKSKPSPWYFMLKQKAQEKPFRVTITGCRYDEAKGKQGIYLKADGSALYSYLAESFPIPGLFLLISFLRIANLLIMLVEL